MTFVKPVSSKLSTVSGKCRTMNYRLRTTTRKWVGHMLMLYQYRSGYVLRCWRRVIPSACGGLVFTLSTSKVVCLPTYTLRPQTTQILVLLFSAGDWSLSALPHACALLIATLEMAILISSDQESDSNFISEWGSVDSSSISSDKELLLIIMMFPSTSCL